MSMASSSSGSSNQWEYDVFVSFRGTDTRRGFTSHLHSALLRNEVRTFLDDKGLEMGKEIAPGLLTAIRKSRASIVVLSTSYASSHWCLDELVEINRLYRAGQHHVYPVFFDVEPSAVRNQTGSFMGAFDKHAQKFTVDKLQGWRSALTSVGSLKGWHLAGGKSEAEVIEEIVKEISSKINNTLPSMANFNALKRKLAALNCIKEDVESRKKGQLRPGKKLKAQVDNWSRDVETMNKDVGDLEQESLASNFSWSGSSIKISGMKEDVEWLIQSGSFSDGLVIDDPLCTGKLCDMSGFMGEGMEEILDDLWKLLMDDRVGTIGVHGMGGVGKTTLVKQLNNQLQQEARMRVVWVTVSKDLFDVSRLQAKIANQFKVPLSEDDDKTEKATKLFDVLSKEEGYVLILDDLWERIFLEDVGIPKPSTNKSKVVITSRSQEVLQFLDCKIVNKLKPLGEELSWKLFLKKVGEDISDHPDLIPVVKSVAKECGGLPLAIVTVAGSMKAVRQVEEWGNALNELRDHLKSIKGIDAGIFETLRFSFDRLKDTRIQQCFLSCALYPEDGDIDEEELINYWIGDGLVEELERRGDEICRSKSIINKLVNNCLLERVVLVFEYSTKTEVKLKMHDLVRDMALQIISKGPRRFFVQAGMNKVRMPGKQEMGEDVEVVSLMENRIEFRGSWELSSPGYLLLTTLLLQKNKVIEIPDCFFKEMPNLMFLNLSENLVKFLPDSLSDLEKLTCLILYACVKLEKVPCLSKLKGLKQLDLGWTSLREFPMGMEELVNLKYLRISVRGVNLFKRIRSGSLLEEIPGSILGKLVSLQQLYVSHNIAVRGELANLKRLEFIKARLRDACDLNAFFESLHGRILPCYDIMLERRALIKLLKDRTVNYEERCISLWADTGGRRIELPSNVMRLRIKCMERDMRSLNNNNAISMTSLMEVTDLKHLHISNCKGMDCVFSAWCPQFNSLQTLMLSYLEELIALFGFVPRPPSGMLNSLTKIYVDRCHKMKKLFSFECLPPNLEEIVVIFCDRMEEIIASRWFNSDAEQTQQLCLPKLKVLKLMDLPQLRSVCTDSELAVASDALVEIEVYQCPLLRRIPLHLPLLPNGQPSRYFHFD